MKNEKPIRVQIFRPKGELSLEDSIEMKKIFNAYLVEGLVHVVINMGKISHIHLAGLPIFLEQKKKFKSYGGEIKLCDVSPYLQHIMDLADVKRFFNIYDTEEQASDSFS